METAEIIATDLAVAIQYWDEKFNFRFRKDNGTTRPLFFSEVPTLYKARDSIIAFLSGENHAR